MTLIWFCILEKKPEVKRKVLFGDIKNFTKIQKNKRNKEKYQRRAQNTNSTKVKQP